MRFVLLLVAVQHLLLDDEAASSAGMRLGLRLMVSVDVLNRVLDRYYLVFVVFYFVY